MRGVHYFTDEYLARARKIPAKEVLAFLEAFRLLHAQGSHSKQIRVKVPEPLLSAFKFRARVEGVPFQTRIKELMTVWLENRQAGQV
jgi:predicted DNA binding CopG/RHH family protein